MAAEVEAARARWRQVAASAGVGGEEIARMRSAFETDQAEVAARLLSGSRAS